MVLANPTLVLCRISYFNVGSGIHCPYVFSWRAFHALAVVAPKLLSWFGLKQEFRSWAKCIWATRNDLHTTHTQARNPRNHTC